MQKPSGAGAPIASPGEKLSGHRLFGTDALTEEECGQECNDFVYVKTSAGVLS